MTDPFDEPDDEMEGEGGDHDSGADTEAEVRCPYCGQANVIALDPGSGSAQEYVEDCQVCCRPWRVIVAYGADGSAEVTVEAD